MQRPSRTTSHQQTDAQPLSEQWLLWKTISLTPVLLLSTALHGTGEVSVASSGRPSRLCPLPASCLLCGEGRGGNEKALSLCEHCSAMGKAPACFGQASKTQPRAVSCEDSYLHPSQTQCTGPLAQ